jgi:hypothetical protein
MSRKKKQEAGIPESSQTITKALPPEKKPVDQLPTSLQDLTNEDEKAALNELIKLYQSGKITEMIGWYESSSELAVGATIERRPLFKRSEKLQNTGVAVHPEILRRAVEKMQGEKAKVGKSLSQLVEYLLWQYIGRPNDLLEK